MKPLTDEQIAELPSWDNERLFWRFEMVSDRRKCIAVQNAFGVAHKDDSDPDVAQMNVEYAAERAEILSRIGNKYKKALDEFEMLSNELALIGAQHAVGIPLATQSGVEIMTLKGDLNAAVAALLAGFS